MGYVRIKTIVRVIKKMKVCVLKKYANG